MTGSPPLATKRVRDTEPVRRRDRRCRWADPGLPGEARAGRGALRPRQLRHLHVPLRGLRLLPERRDAARRPAPTTRPSSPTGRWTSSRRCWRATCPSTRTRSTPTGTTSATSTSCARATSTRCAGRSRSSPGRREVADGRLRPRARSTGPRSTAPVLVGAGVELGEGVRIEGPAIVGDGCRIGDGARIRDAILLERTELAGRGDPGRRHRGSRQGHLDGLLTIGAPRARRRPAGSSHESSCTPSPSGSCRRSAQPAGAPAGPSAVVCTRCARRLASAVPLSGDRAPRYRPRLVLGPARGRRPRPRHGA